MGVSLQKIEDQNMMMKKLETNVANKGKKGSSCRMNEKRRESLHEVNLRDFSTILAFSPTKRE